MKKNKNTCSIVISKVILFRYSKPFNISLKENQLLKVTHLPIFQERWIQDGFKKPHDVYGKFKIDSNVADQNIFQSHFSEYFLKIFLHSVSFHFTYFIVCYIILSFICIISKTCSFRISNQFCHQRRKLFLLTLQRNYIYFSSVKNK